MPVVRPIVLCTVLVDIIGQVMTIGINRPEKRNCVDTLTAQRLVRVITQFEADSSVKAGVLYGTGGNFCSGLDLNEVSNFMEDQEFNFQQGQGPMGPTRKMIKKPLVAAVSGYAVAGGFELALMCDLRVVEETAVMGVFSRRFGIPLIDGGTVRLPALIGLSRALDLILTGRSIKAKEAFEWGLANRLVACGTALGQALNLATSLVKFPQACLLADRSSAYYSKFDCISWEDALNFERRSSNQLVLKESIKGAKKFVSGVGRHGKSISITEEDDF
ncbi:probable enoyl-CoA hydratase isoform X2 [Anabrus simplex]|uniref:probable enoyl-CoA hydratase isoform X2 n=1 Tax=Anabrus simplex TaxID=316456 RepID=UPI0035A2C9B1